MPIIPRYNLAQTATHLTVEVSIPHVRVSMSTLDLVIVDGTELHLYAPPTYLLRLNLPGRVVDEDAVEESLASSSCRPVAGSDDGVARLVVEAGESNCIDDEEGEDDRNCTAGTKSTTGATAVTSRVWTRDDLPVFQYDPEKNHGTLFLILRKEEEGYWQDLDLLGRLQQPTMHRLRRQQPAERDVPPAMRTTNIPLVKVISERDDKVGDHDDGENSEDNTTASEVMTDLLSINQNRPTYGLFRQFSNVFHDYAREGLAHDMLECPNPDEAHDDSGEDDCVNGDHPEQWRNRREMRLQMENDKFDADRYLNDLHIDEEGDMIFDAAMSMVPHWMTGSHAGASPPNFSNESVDDVTYGISKLSTSDDGRNQNLFFDADESHLLATLPPQSKRRTMHLTAEQERSAFLCLADLLFAYAFDHRTTEGDPTVESSWTIMTLSISLSWLENFNPPYDTIVDVVRWNIRRSLIYPYLRSHSLSMKICSDLCRILTEGRRVVIRCLLQLHRIMENSEFHYLFNKLYIDPLISWVQECNESEVRVFGREIEAVLVDDANENEDGTSSGVFGKDCMGLGLDELEKSLLTCDDGNSISPSEGDDDSYCGSDEDSDDDEDGDSASADIQESAIN
ncbi:hypothetical protein ACHAW5_006870 [Stephanodiscus triporus]|uniref:CS domain-containing protein n=1 Tax=Stephanodiscus triporus TaxID=2934178 RepID=A0ABD3QU15_9STRA